MDSISALVLWFFFIIVIFIVAIYCGADWFTSLAIALFLGILFLIIVVPWNFNSYHKDHLHEYQNEWIFLVGIVIFLSLLFLLYFARHRLQTSLDY